MSDSPREPQILAILNKKGRVSVQELAETLSVSVMTVHRDLNQLAAEGLIVKAHGGASLPSQPSGENKCGMCGKPLSERTLFIINLPDGNQRRACCAHCGLMMHSHMGGTALTADFLHNHIISANQALFLIHSELTVCCAPSVLSFGSRADAEKFQRGFGGQLASMDEALQFLHGSMHPSRE
jgi:biotin operon repressor